MLMNKSNERSILTKLLRKLRSSPTTSVDLKKLKKELKEADKELELKRVELQKLLEK